MTSCCYLFLKKTSYQCFSEHQSLEMFSQDHQIVMNCANEATFLLCIEAVQRRDRFSEVLNA